MGQEAETYLSLFPFPSLRDWAGLQMEQEVEVISTLPWTGLQDWTQQQENQTPTYLE
jgi:hypothetical protein